MECRLWVSENLVEIIRELVEQTFTQSIGFAGGGPQPRRPMLGKNYLPHSLFPSPYLTNTTTSTGGPGYGHGSRES